MFMLERTIHFMNRKRNIYIMYAIALLQGMVFYGPAATLYRQEAGTNVFHITVIDSVPGAQHGGGAALGDCG